MTIFEQYMAASRNTVLRTLDRTHVQNHPKHRLNHTLETYMAKNEMLLVDLRNIPPKHTLQHTPKHTFRLNTQPYLWKDPYN